MGVFQEDSEIHVSELIKLWVADGFLKPIDGKSLEVVAEEYLMELIDRNLIIVHKLDSNGVTKLCKIHDLLRDLCLREARKQKFLCVVNLHDLNNNPQGIDTERRIIINGTSKHKYGPPQVLDFFQNPSLARSLIVHYEINDFEGALRSGNLRLLRVLKVESPDILPIFWVGVYELYNLRYISTWDIEFCESLSASLYWNLHTLHAVECIRSDIWTMPLLRHVELNSFFLPDPPNAHIFLGNLQTLSSVRISQCHKEVVERISNVKKLRISCEESDTDSLLCFNNLSHLHKLEHLSCYFDLYLFPINLILEETLRSELQRNVAFPFEGQFCSLKFLLIDFCDNLVRWTTDDTHFPRLEHLRLKRLDKLTEIPLSIGDIPTLQSIELERCSYSAIMSAKRILKEQEELGNEGLRVEINNTVVKIKELAAYAALVSVMHIIDQIEHHPRPPISLHKLQVESLTEKIAFLQEFLEGYKSHVVNSSEADALEMRIADAAYAAEDAIESHIMDQIHGKNTTMVGFDDVLLEIMDKLTRGELDRRIIPIVGMGGIGKTTLARNLYAKPLIIEHFDICAWATISQEYDTREILSDILSQFKKEEDKKIRVSQLIKLWVAEGFLKPINGKSLEVVAEEYLMELIDRNIILVDKLGSNGNTKLCKIHDLLRDLCLREAQKQKFLCVIKLRNLSSTPSLNTERCIIIHGRTPEECDSPQVLNALLSASLARSLIVQYMSIDFDRALQSADLRFLRVFKVENSGLLLSFTEYDLYNLRYMSTKCLDFPYSRLQANFYWNLQTLQSDISFGVMDSEISMMPLLRHARLNDHSLPDPLNGQIVLENLQTLSSVSISKCREKVVERFPNLKTLRINCGESDSLSLHCFRNLGLLHRLEHLKCDFVPLSFRNTHSFKKTFQRLLLQYIAFPHSLKKLTLSGSQFHWEDITTKIGPLPHLQVLKLEMNAAAGADWVTDEGKFRSLKFLLIRSSDDFVNWMTDNTHFPRLEHLRLRYMDKLKEIPWGIGEIPTLESIELFHCSSSAVMSAKRILEEQEELGNEGLRLVINTELVMEMVAVIVIEGKTFPGGRRNHLVSVMLRCQ
ncbi:hypothetical protein ACS0TY_036232 [Phlomoides rotata]